MSQYRLSDCANGEEPNLYLFFLNCLLMLFSSFLEERDKIGRWWEIKVVSNVMKPSASLVNEKRKAFDIVLNGEKTESLKILTV